MQSATDVAQTPGRDPLMPGVSRIAVLIATKGRPQTLNRLLRLLERQTLAISTVVVSATTESDLGDASSSLLNVVFITGSPGTSVQRNRALDKVKDDCDVAIFFDDDFAPSSNWIERCKAIFESQPAVVGISGLLLRDGATTGSISWDEAEGLLAQPISTVEHQLSDRSDLYGCNMAFRMSAIKDARFDERLILYGWLEDKDFARRAAKFGRLVHADSTIGVHLGLKSNRVAGKRFGYSQVVNPWYLCQKGTVPFVEVCAHILKAISINSLKSFRPEASIDRRGRLCGNLVGLRQLVLGRARPERAAEL
jgi:glycosyltransferase involved in cell wall biosynthesis